MAIRTLDKSEVARRQLITAIELFFHDKDAVSAHTLSQAAHEILDELCVKAGLQRGVVSEGLKNLDDTTRKKYRDQINEAKNYFKHADRDADCVLEWDPEVAIHFIIDAVSLYKRLSNGKSTCEMFIFSFWYRATYPQLFDIDESMDTQFKEASELFSQVSRSEAYESLLKKCHDIGFES